jgi:uncharacterized DUF497 family protein
MIYEWDETKRTTNLLKHGLDFLHAYEVLESEDAMIVDSPRKGKARQQSIGLRVRRAVHAVGGIRAGRREPLSNHQLSPGQAN